MGWKTVRKAKLMYLEVKMKEVTQKNKKKKKKKKERMIYLHVKKQQECTHEVFIRG